MKTITEVRTAFWEYLKQLGSGYATEYRKGKRQNEYNATIRAYFVDYVDQLHKDGQISDKLANRATL